MGVRHCEWTMYECGEPATCKIRGMWVCEEHADVVEEMQKNAHFLLLAPVGLLNEVRNSQS